MAILFLDLFRSAASAVLTQDYLESQFMIEVTIPMNLPVRMIVADRPGALRPEWHLAEFSPVRARVTGLELSAIQRERQAVEQLRKELELERQQLLGERAALATSLVELQRVASQVDVKLNGLLSEVREVTVELAHAIASKLVFEQVEDGQFPITNLVQELIARVPAREAVVIKLHPDDLAQLKKHPSIQGSSEERVVQYVADDTLDRGDCKAVAGEIKVVYQLRHQVEEIRRQLLSTVSGHDEIGT